jgi:hypothetical protein
MSFVRRFSSMPSPAVISQIEGIVIVDLTPPTTFAGVNTGVVGLVGEFADMSYAVSVDGAGNVTTKPRPVEVSSAQDMLNKVGGFDSTLGDFGGDDGNGFVAINGKRFSRLVLCPVNLASPKGVRLWRELPLNKSETSATPKVPMAAASIPAGTTFTSGSNRAKLAKTVTFTADAAIAYGVNGQQNDNSGPAASAFFQAAGANFQIKGVQVGDALVLGATGGDGVPGTYRIISVDSDTQIQVEALDASDFNWDAAPDLPWRIHPAAAFDTGAQNTHSEQGGYLLPARAIGPASVAAGTAMSVVSAIPNAAGLSMGVMPDDGVVLGGLAYDADVQAENAVQSLELDALYEGCFEALLADAYPTRDISILFSARTSDAIRAAMKTHVQTASAQGRGRMAVISPPINEVDLDTVLGDAAPGVGADRDERVIYSWPGVEVSVADAQLKRIKRANGTYTTDGLLDVRADGFMASVLSNLSAERNPGQAADPVPLCLSPILGFQTGNLPDFNMSDYILFRQNGVAAIRFDRAANKSFQSGITTSTVATEKNINRRRMADEIQDSLAAIYEKFSKLPLTNQLKDAIEGETVAYLEGLLSATNPASQRIEAYSVDSKSGNTPELNAQGIYVVVVRVRMLATADDIVLQAEVGPTVTISTT